MAHMAIAYEQRIDAQRKIRILFLRLFRGESIDKKLIVIVAHRIGLIEMYVGMKETHITYRQLTFEEEGFPLHLGGHPLYREQLLALLIINAEAVHHDVGREKPMHSTQAYSCAYAILQFSGKKHRHTLLHPWRIHKHSCYNDNERHCSKSKLYVSSLLYIHLCMQR